MAAAKIFPPFTGISKLNPNAAPFVPGGRPHSPTHTTDTSSEHSNWTIEQAKKNFSEYKTRDLNGHKKKIHSVAWNCNGRKLASGSVDQTVRVWNIETNKDIELKGHTDSVDQLCWDPTHPDILCTASADKTIRVSFSIAIDINVAWSPDGNYVAVGNKEDCVTIIDPRKYKVLKNHRFQYEVNEIGWNNTGDLFFLTTGLGTVEIFRWVPASNELQPLRSISAHTANTYCIEFDPLNRYFAVGSADAVVTLWDINEMVCIRSFCKLQYPLRTISFSHDGQFLALASEDHIIGILVNLGLRKYFFYELHILHMLKQAVAWHPKQMILAYAGDEKDHHSRDLGAVRLFGPFTDNR